MDLSQFWFCVSGGIVRWGKDFCRFRPEKRKEFRVATGNALLLGKETTDASTVRRV